MQINGSILTTGFNSKPGELDLHARKPVVIDAEPVFAPELATEQQSQQAEQQGRVLSPLEQQAISVNDAQQARFVRFFAATDEPSSNRTNATIESDVRPLPSTVQQYLNNATDNTETTRLFDEIV